ncbi:hypothetical protein DJ564_24345 [Pseudomonas sp. 31-12]|nr:hypothetical protein DJ564_24345 [Pseudomonas sp. 31-12]
MTKGRHFTQKPIVGEVPGDGTLSELSIPLWRGSLLPLGRAAAPKPSCPIVSGNPHRPFFATAAQPNGSKLPRHNGYARPCGD